MVLPTRLPNSINRNVIAVSLMSTTKDNAKVLKENALVSALSPRI